MKINVENIKQGLKRKNRYILVLILLSFSLTFVVIRIITHLQKAGIIPNQDGAVHFHHMIIGILGLIIIGFISIVFDNAKKRSWIAIAYGIAAALTIDEFALWLFLKDVYWSDQGRLSVEAVGAAIGIIIIVILVNEATNKTITQKIESEVKKRLQN